MSSLIAEFQALNTRAAQSDVDTSLEMLLAEMEPDSARCLRLAAIPHQIDSDILQVLDPNLNKERAADLFEEFSDLPIVTFNPDGMALHDEARRQLFQQWVKPPVDSEFTAASKRLVTHFAKAVTNASDAKGKDVFETAQMFHLLGADQAAGFAMFEQLCRQRRREFRLDDCDHLIILAHEYDSVLTPEHQQRLAYHEGKLAADRCNWQQAQETFERLLQTKSLESHLEINVTNRLGMVLDEKRDYAGAIEYYQEALSLAANHPDGEVFVYRILVDLGTAHRDSGNFEEAEKLLKKSIELAKKHNDLAATAEAYNSLGALYRKKQEPWEAIAAYEKSLSYLNQSHDILRPAQVYNNLGVVHRELGKWDESRILFERSRDISREVGDATGQAKTLNNLIAVYSNLNQNEAAIKAAEEAIRLFEQSHDTYNAALTTRNLGRLYGRMKERDKAAATFREAITSFEQCRAPDEVAETARDLARLHERRSGVVFWILAGLIGAGILMIALLLIVAVLSGANS